MDLEKLNKSQIVLLTLLVSFVTSIATGIVTVALMEQAPQAITQTVNRIVERTVEKVSSDTQVAAAASSEPIIIRESDLIATAIEAVSPSVVRLFQNSQDPSTGQIVPTFIGTAIVVDSSGTLIADAGTPDGALTAVRFDGAEVSASVVARPEGVNMVRLQASSTTTDQKDAVKWTPVTLSSDGASLGKTVVAFGGRSSTKIARGVITGSSGGENNTAIVETDIPTDSFAAGSPLIDSDGKVIAIATRGSREAAPGGFLASSAIVLQNKDSEGAPTAP